MPTPPTQLPPSRSSPTPPAQRPAGHTTAAVTTQTSAPSRATHGVHGQTFAAATGAGSKHRVSPPPDPKGKRPAFSSSAAPKARQGAEDAEDAEDQLFLGRRRLPQDDDHRSAATELDIPALASWVFGKSAVKGPIPNAVTERLYDMYTFLKATYEGKPLSKCLKDLGTAFTKIEYLDSPSKIVCLYILLKHSFVDPSNVDPSKSCISFEDHADQGENATTTALRQSVMALVLRPQSKSVIAKSAADYLQHELRDNNAGPSHADRRSPRDLYNQLIHWILDGGIDSHDVHREHSLPLLSDVMVASRKVVEQAATHSLPEQASRIKKAYLLLPCLPVAKSPFAWEMVPLVSLPSPGDGYYDACHWLATGTMLAQEDSYKEKLLHGLCHYLVSNYPGDRKLLLPTQQGTGKLGAHQVRELLTAEINAIHSDASAQKALKAVIKNDDGGHSQVHETFSIHLSNYHFAFLRKDNLLPTMQLERPGATPGPSQHS